MFYKLISNVAVFILIFISQSTFGETKIPPQLSISTGSYSATFSENPDELKSTDGTNTTTSTPYSGTTTSLPLEFTYEMFSSLTKSYAIKASAPLVANATGRYFNLSGAMNFYFNSLASDVKVSDFNFQLSLKPKFRYYAAPSLGLAYLVYNTKSATKTDILFEIGGNVGTVYAISSRWGAKAEIGFARALGVLVSATVIKISLGTTYTFEL